MKAAAFDKKFDSGSTVLKSLNLRKASRPGMAMKRVNVDFPDWVISGLDKEAKRIGITRQSVIKTVIADHLTRSTSR